MEDSKLLQKLIAQLERYLLRLEQLRLQEYMQYLGDRKRLMRSHFLGGLARGLGMAVGFTILGAILVLVLQRLASRNLPVIGDFLAEIVSIVQRRLDCRGGTGRFWGERPLLREKRLSPQTPLSRRAAGV